MVSYGVATLLNFVLFAQTLIYPSKAKDEKKTQ